MIEGHKLKGLRDNYYRPKDDTVLQGTTTIDGKIHLAGYLELMSELIINDENRLRREVEVLQVKASGLDAMMARMDALEAKLRAGK